MFLRQADKSLIDSVKLGQELKVITLRNANYVQPQLAMNEQIRWEGEQGGQFLDKETR